MYPRTTLGLLTVSSVAVIALFIVTAFIIQRPVTERYQDADAVRGALAGEGVFCTGMEELEPPPEVQSYGECHIDDELVGIYIPDSEVVRDSLADSIAEGPQDFKVLVGENWLIVSVYRSAVDAAAEALGGELH